jgi:hypothetical protein
VQYSFSRNEPTVSSSVWGVEEWEAKESLIYKMEELHPHHMLGGQFVDRRKGGLLGRIFVRESRIF